MADEKTEIELEDEWVNWDNRGDIKKYRPIRFKYQSTDMGKELDCEIKIRTPQAKDVDLEKVKNAMEQFAMNQQSFDSLNKQIDKVLQEDHDQYRIEVYHFDPDDKFDLPCFQYNSKMPAIIVRDYE